MRAARLKNSRNESVKKVGGGRENLKLVRNDASAAVHSRTYMYMYYCDFFVCFRTYLFVRALLPKILQLRRYRKAVRNPWSRFELDPSTVARVAGAQSFFFGSG